MIMTRSVMLLTALAVLATAVPALPHHPVGQVYDESQTVTLEGKIVRLVYRNPHSLLHLQVVGQHGVERTWAIEWGGRRPSPTCWRRARYVAARRPRRRLWESWMGSGPVPGMAPRNDPTRGRLVDRDTELPDRSVKVPGHAPPTGVRP